MPQCICKLLLFITLTHCAVAICRTSPSTLLQLCAPAHVRMVALVPELTCVHVSQDGLECFVKMVSLSINYVCIQCNVLLDMHTVVREIFEGNILY